MRTPASVLADLLRSDPATPRVTFYEDTAGDTQGERIELSGKVLANWVAKAGNALQDEYDLGRGSVIRLSLPPHWRALYWALAAWSVGATVDLSGDGGTGGVSGAAGAAGTAGDGAKAADLLICDDPYAVAATPAPGDIVLVTLGALARVHTAALPPGAMDEARELATYGDQLVALAEPAPDDLALVTPQARTPYRSVVTERGWPVNARVSVAGDLAQVLESALAAWAVDGSVVLARTGPRAGAGSRPERLASERVTLDLARGEG